MKSIRLNSTEMNVYIAGNFDVVQADIAADFAHTGEWYEYFSGESLNVSDVNMDITLQHGEYRLYTDVELETPDIGTATNEIPDEPGGLFRIFPNPVEAVAGLQIELQESTKLKIIVYNILGSEMLRVEERPYPEGKQVINFDVAALKSGIYFCNIISDQSGDTIKFLKR